MEGPCDEYEMLYQPGFNHISLGLKVKLEMIFKNWTEKVQKGEWTIDADGVTGGAEKFKEADTEEHWDKYVI